LPVIHEVLKDDGEATIFSTLYLRIECWQIPLTDQAKKYTAFVTPDGGQYDFNPFRAPGGGKDVHATRRPGSPGRFDEEVLHALP
jgi:hypothetical protein